MAFLKRVKQAVIVDRLLEEKLYEQVLHELESGIRRDGLWAKAFQNSQGDEQKAKALYFKYRIQSLKDEADILDALAEQHEKEKQKKIQQNPSKIMQVPEYKKKDHRTYCEKPIAELKEDIVPKNKSQKEAPDIGCLSFFLPGVFVFCALFVFMIILIISSL